MKIFDEVRKIFGNRGEMHHCIRGDARPKKLGAHNKFSFQTGFTHISSTSSHIQTSLGKMLHKRNFMCTQTLKIRGNSHWPTLRIHRTRTIFVHGQQFNRLSQHCVQACTCTMYVCLCVSWPFMAWSSSWRSSIYYTNTGHQ